MIKEFRDVYFDNYNQYKKSKIQSSLLTLEKRNRNLHEDATVFGILSAQIEVAILAPVLAPGVLDDPVLLGPAHKQTRVADLISARSSDSTCIARLVEGTFKVLKVGIVPVVDHGDRTVTADQFLQRKFVANLIFVAKGVRLGGLLPLIGLAVLGIVLHNKPEKRD